MFMKFIFEQKNIVILTTLKSFLDNDFDENIVRISEVIVEFIFLT